jgi:hypothetical protein
LRAHRFLPKKIEQINKKTTVILEEVVQMVLTLPNLCSRAERFQPGHQIGSGICVLTGKNQEGRVEGRKRGSRSSEFSKRKVAGRGMAVEAVTRRGT